MMIRKLTLIFVLVFMLLLSSTPVLALTLSVSGNFDTSVFEVKRGEGVTYSEVYMKITNFNDFVLDYEVTIDSPPGVTIELSQSTGSIPINSRAYIYIEAISVSKRVKKGEYPISLTASTIPYGGYVISIEQQNTLTVLNPSKRKQIIFGKG